MLFNSLSVFEFVCSLVTFCGNLIRFFQRANLMLFYTISANQHICNGEARGQSHCLSLNKSAFRKLLFRTNRSYNELCAVILRTMSEYTYIVQVRSMEFRVDDLDYLLNRQLSMRWKGSFCTSNFFCSMGSPLFRRYYFNAIAPLYGYWIGVL